MLEEGGNDSEGSYRSGQSFLHYPTIHIGLCTMSSSFFQGAGGPQQSNSGDSQWAGWANEPEVFRKVKKKRDRYGM